MNDSGYTLWFTGMMGAGKRTLARHVFQRFSLLGKRCEYLSDDDLEPFLPAPLDAPLEVRNRNARVLGWTAELLTRQGVITVVASVSPIREVREEIRRRIGRYAEVFVDCSFDILVERDEARIYERAMEGQIQNVVGVHLPYEPPPYPDVRVDSGEGDVETLAAQVFEGLFELGFLSRTERDILLGRIEPAPVLPAAEGGGGADDGMSNAMDAVGVVEVTAPKKRAPAKKTTKATAKTAAKKTTKATAKTAAKKPTKATAKTAAKKTTKAAAKAAATTRRTRDRKSVV